MICKSIAASVVRGSDGAHVVFTRTLTTADLDDLGGVDYAAHLFQPFVESTHAVRLVAVGEQLFAATIAPRTTRGREDWRSDPDNLVYGTCDVSADVTAGVNRYMKLAGLTFGAWDFLVTEDGHWVALEVNAEGQYGWLQSETSLPITEAIAGFLGSEEP